MSPLGWMANNLTVRPTLVGVKFDPTSINKDIVTQRFGIKEMEPTWVTTDNFSSIHAAEEPDSYPCMCMGACEHVCLA